MTARASRSGFTLLEMMIVVAIIGIVSAMSVATLDEMGSRNSTQNAASDVVTELQLMRARAQQRGSDIYVIVYPTMTKAGALTGGRGALFFYEDADGDFLTGTGACDGTAECGWTNFTPPTNIRSVATERDRLLKAIYLEDYAKKNVRFGKAATTAFTAPFTAVGSGANANGCSFCSTGASARGALVFTGDQQLRFLDNAGAPVAQRVGGLALQGVKDPDNTILFGLVSATGYVATVR